MKKTAPVVEQSIFFARAVAISAMPALLLPFLNRGNETNFSASPDDREISRTLSYSYCGEIIDSPWRVSRRSPTVFLIHYHLLPVSNRYSFQIALIQLYRADVVIQSMHGCAVPSFFFFLPGASSDASVLFCAAFFLCGRRVIRSRCFAPR